MGNCFPKPVTNLSSNNKIPTPVIISSDEKKKEPMIGKRPTTEADGGRTRETVVMTAVPPSGRIVTPNLKSFTFSELKSATRNFRPDTVLGEGGFGRVFKGWVDGETYAPSKVGIGIPVAVKKSNPDSAQGVAGRSEISGKIQSSKSCKTSRILLGRSVIASYDRILY